MQHVYAARTRSHFIWSNQHTPCPTSTQSKPLIHEHSDILAVLTVHTNTSQVASYIAIATHQSLHRVRN